MADNETIADIIAEMLGARTEFPFVYLMGEPDTPEVIDPKTNKIIEPRKINIRRVTVKELADRFDAAHKRERGDCAKLREALIDVVKRLEAYTGCDHHTFHPTATTCDGITSIGKCGKIGTCAAIFKARAALAAPPRNCDRPECATTKSAADVWRKEDGGKTAYYEWLLCTATEKEGGNDGNK